MSDTCYTNTLETDGLSTGEILYQAKATLHAAHQRACKALEMVQGLLRRHPNDADLRAQDANLFRALCALNNARSQLPDDIPGNHAKTRPAVSSIWDTATAAMMAQRERFQSAPTIKLTGEEADELMAQAEASDEPAPEMDADGRMPAKGRT